MGIIETEWRNRRCRYEDGIFFGSDEHIPLGGSPDKGFTTAPRTSIASLVLAEPDGWTELDERTACDARHGEFTMFGGAASWEGAGFIAVESASRLLWVVHLCSSEEFFQLTTDGTLIVAHSRGHGFPWAFEWRVPIASPEALTVRRLEG